METLESILKREITPEETLELKRAKHLFVQWLVSGNRRSMPGEAKPFISSSPEEARALFERFSKRSRQKPKGKKHLFAS